MLNTSTMDTYLKSKDACHHSDSNVWCNDLTEQGIETALKHATIDYELQILVSLILFIFTVL